MARNVHCMIVYTKPVTPATGVAPVHPKCIALLVLQKPKQLSWYSAQPQDDRKRHFLAQTLNCLRIEHFTHAHVYIKHVKETPHISGIKQTYHKVCDEGKYDIWNEAERDQICQCL